MVLHSVDHYKLSEILKYVDFPLDGQDLCSYCKLIVSIWYWVMPIGSFFCNEYILASKKTFYSKLYTKYAAINKDYTDHKIYSTVF